jgi:hypothetical protein
MGKIKAILLGVCLLLIGTHYLDARPVVDKATNKIVLTSKDIRAAVATTYVSQIGVRETLGANDSPEIREYLAITNVRVPAAWCAAFVSYCYTKNGVPNPRSAWSPSYFAATKLVDIRKDKPLQADLFGVWYNNLNRIAHVGFVDSWPREGDYFITVEGNTNDNGSREGNGVYKKRRLKRSASKISRWINESIKTANNDEYRTTSAIQSWQPGRICQDKFQSWTSCSNHNASMERRSLQPDRISRLRHTDECRISINESFSCRRGAIMETNPSRVAA